MAGLVVALCCVFMLCKAVVSTESTLCPTSGDDFSCYGYNLTVVVISVSDERFQNSISELSYLKLLSLALATKDILQQAAGNFISLKANGWWLVLEDDVMLNTDGVHFRSALRHVFRRASSDGVVKLGMCTPESCTGVEALNGVEFGKCASHCTHAVAYSSQKAHVWQGIYGRPVPGHDADSMYTDMALLLAGASTGGFWSAGLNFVSATNSEHCGLFLQDDKKFKSLLSAEPGERQPARSSQFSHFKQHDVRARIVVIAFALALLLAALMLRTRGRIVEASS